MKITYKINEPITTGQFISLLKESALAERRPVNDRECMEGMLQNSNLMVTAWDGIRPVGIARSVTDFHYACYLSDLAVDQKYQRMGIGKKLQALTKEQLGPHCKLILIAAPAAHSYYRHLGYSNNTTCWVLAPDQPIE